jgi:hypothetical protein
MNYPDYYVMGDPKLKEGQTLAHWFDTSKSIWVQRPAGTLRVTPLRSPNLRIHSAPQFDATVIREFSIREGHRFQIKASAYNLTNTPLFNSADTNPTSTTFGVVPTTQRNLPRGVEFGMRYRF